MKYKKSQLIFGRIMIAFIIIVAVIALISPYKQTNDTVLDNMDCNNATSEIGTGTKGSCIITDWSLFYWIGSGIAVAVGFIGLRKPKIL